MDDVKREVHLYVGERAEVIALRDAVREIDPEALVWILLDEPNEELNPGHPTLIVYLGSLAPEVVASKMRELVPWDVRTDAEMDELTQQ